MITIGPNTALALSFSGVLGIYLEFLRPGRAVAGCLGIVLLMWGGYRLWLFGPTLAGSLLIGLSILLFGSELVLNSRFAAGVAGTAALFFGLQRLLPPQHAFNTAFLIPVTMMLGVLITLVCISAREARRSKRPDLS